MHSRQEGSLPGIKASNAYLHVHTFLSHKKNLHNWHPDRLIITTLCSCLRLLLTRGNLIFFFLLLLQFFHFQADWQLCAKIPPYALMWILTISSPMWQTVVQIISCVFPFCAEEVQPFGDHTVECSDLASLSTKHNCSLIHLLPTPSSYSSGRNMHSSLYF